MLSLILPLSSYHHPTNYWTDFIFFFVSKCPTTFRLTFLDLSFHSNKSFLSLIRLSFSTSFSWECSLFSFPLAKPASGPPHSSPGQSHALFSLYPNRGTRQQGSRRAIASTRRRLFSRINIASAQAALWSQPRLLQIRNGELMSPGRTIA